MLSTMLYSARKRSLLALPLTLKFVCYFSLRPASLDLASLETLETFRISDAPSYIAVSYEWEGPLARFSGESILQIRNLTITLKSKLARALECFQNRFSKHKYLWIDAICISQADSEERGHQVQIMRDIYQHACAVWVWLGPATHDSGLAMDVIDEVSRFPEEMRGQHCRSIKWIQRVIYDPEYARHRLALYSLFGRSYWKRLWIVQELVLGAFTDEPLLWCGNRFSALGHVTKLSKGIRAVIELKKSTNSWKGITRQKLERAVKVITDLADHIDEQSGNASSPKGGNLLSLPKRYTGNHCVDPRDKIYALLGVAQLETPGLQVDYSIDIEEVCRRTTLYMLETSNNLDFLTSCSWEETDMISILSDDQQTAISMIQNAFDYPTEPECSPKNVGLDRRERIYAGSIWTALPSVGKNPSWVPQWGKNLGAQLFPATKIKSRRYFSGYYDVTISRDSIELYALFCGEIFETLPLWISGTRSSEKEHLERVLQILLRIKLSHERHPDVFSPGIARERDTAALLYDVLFSSTSSQVSPVEHPFVDRQTFVQWGASFLCGTTSTVQIPDINIEYVEQPQRILFLYSEYGSRTNELETPEYGFGLCIAGCRPSDEVTVLQTCEDIFLIQRADRGGEYKVLGQCYAQTLDGSFGMRKTPSENLSSHDDATKSYEILEKFGPPQEIIFI